MLVVDKPKGISSFDVIRRLRGPLKTRSIGHTGTLDPAATGVLCLCLGWATKLIQFLDDDHKVYRAVMRLGTVTDTDDGEGHVRHMSDMVVSAEELEAVLPSFVGLTSQRPPAFSAIKVNGRRSYRAARKGKRIELPRRTVRIDRIELLRFDWPDATLVVTCGKGTYIRSLARDMGARLGCGAHLAGLRRLVSGRATIQEALNLETIFTRLEQGQVLPIKSPLKMLSHLERLELSSDDSRRLRQGQRPHLDDTSLGWTKGTLVRVTEEGSDELVAVGRVVGGGSQRFRVQPVKVRPQR
jgi:tRNA pseudouridine55 synthase